jgi:hypothetical protein
MLATGLLAEADVARMSMSRSGLTPSTMTVTVSPARSGQDRNRQADHVGNAGGRLTAQGRHAGASKRHGLPMLWTAAREFPLVAGEVIYNSRAACGVSVAPGSGWS